MVQWKRKGKWSQLKALSLSEVPGVHGHYGGQLLASGRADKGPPTTREVLHPRQRHISLAFHLPRCRTVGVRESEGWQTPRWQLRRADIHHCTRW